MLLIPAEVTAIVLGLAVHAVLPRRELTGIVLLPAVSGAAAAIVWTGLTWLGVEDGGALMWLVSLAAGVLSAVAVGLPVRRSRQRSDTARLASAR